MGLLILAIFASVALAQSPECAVDGSAVNAITGDPVARVKVSMVGAAGSASQVTDISGKWEFGKVPCTAVQVVAERQGFLLGQYTGAPGHDLKIRLMPHAVISGRVMDDQGEPVAKTPVYILQSAVIQGWRTFLPATFTTTNDLGEYRLPGLTGGKYIVCARAAGALPVLSSTHTFYGDQCYPGPVGQSAGIQIAAARENKIDFTLKQVPAARVRGMVYGLPEGTNIGVTLIPSGANPSLLADRSVSSHRDGEFDIADVAPGSYVLKANLARGATHLTAHLPIEVGASGVEGVALHLEPASAFKGVVRVETQTDGTPPTRHVQVLLRSLNQGTPSRSAESKDDLVFAIDDVLPGDYRLDVVSVPPSFYVASARVANQDILNKEFAFSQAIGPVEIVLRNDGGSIEGDVADAAGQPVAGSVMAIRDGKALTVPASGHFKLRDLAPGDYRVYAWDDPSQVEYADPAWMGSYGAAGVAVTVTSGQNSQVKLALQTSPR